MARQDIERRLAAIVSADVCGYSRMMANDETGTLNALKVLRRDLIDPIIAKYHGRIVKLMGDGALIEYASVVDAVESSVEVQRSVIEQNAGRPDDESICFRIGINLGDIIIDGDDIYGDGVNIAARLQEIADPDGISVRREVYNQVRDKLPYVFEDMGEIAVKNIPRPIHVFKVLIDGVPTDAGKAAPDDAPKPGPALPDKPSIAVLPFVNMSGDAEQEFFADGITEDIITELARFPSLFVIARNSTFTYKGKSVRVEDVGRELGVHYVVEGSIRKAGNRVRVTVQLVEAATENHVWAERYDRELTDIFEIQDELTQAIVGALPARLEAADIERVKRKPPQDLAAYDYVLRSKVLHHRGTKEANAEAIDVLNKAIDLDPEYVPAYAWKACTLRQGVLRGYADVPESWSAQRVANAEKALALDENDMECLRILCEINMELCQLDQAEQYHNRAFAMNPNDPRMAAQRGELMTWMGRHAEGAEWVEKAMRLDPLGAGSFAHLLGRARLGEHRYAEAIEAYKQIPTPRWQHHADMAACHAYMGDDADAELQKAQVLQLKPDFSIADYLERLTYGEPGDLAHHGEGLRKAGLPD